MSYRIELTSRAKANRTACYDYIAGRNPDGALAWLTAYEKAAASLLTKPHYGESPESEDHDEAIRQKIFKTKHGRPYRLLYVIRDDVVHIIHVRGPGQDVMSSEEVELPGQEE